MAEHEKSNKRPMKVFDRPILSYFILVICTLIVFSLFNAVQTVLGLSGSAADLFNLAYLIPALLISYLLVVKVFFRGTLKGIFAIDGTVDGLKMFIPVAIIDVAAFVLDLILGTNNALNDVLHIVAISCTAGVMEEAVFRVYVLPNFMRVKRDYKGMIFSVLFTAVIFGCTHLFNLSDGGNFGRVISQCVTASISGCLYAAVYLSTGTIVPGIIAHILHDVINLLFANVTANGAMLEAVTWQSLIPQIIFSATELVVAIRLLRPDAFDKIRAIWDEKWGL